MNRPSHGPDRWLLTIRCARALNQSFFRRNNLVITDDKALIARGVDLRNNDYGSLAGMRRTAGIDACGTLT